MGEDVSLQRRTINLKLPAELIRCLDALMLKAYGWGPKDDVLANLLDLILELTELEAEGCSTVGPWDPTHGPHPSPEPLPLLTTGQQLLTMDSFSVFFDGPLGFGIQPVDAIDTDHAVEITSGIHGGWRFSAAPSEELEGYDKHKLLRAWIRGESLDDVSTNG